MEIASALALIEEMIGDFPFTGEPDKANVLATALTPILRPAVSGPTPLALIDAPQAGTGKGLLAEVIALICTGRAAEMMAAPIDEDEWRKHLTAVLSSGASVITIDNVEHRLESAPLAVALTAREWTGRILGLSKTVTVPGSGHLDSQRQQRPFGRGHTPAMLPHSDRCESPASLDTEGIQAPQLARLGVRASGRVIGRPADFGQSLVCR